MVKKKICVIGAFRKSGTPKGGQEIKAHVIANELEHLYGPVYRIDTIGKKQKLLMPIRMIWAVLICDNIIMLPAHKGFVVESILLRWLNIFFSRGLHYVVIGGWLPERLSRHRIAANALSNFVGIYVETSTMCNQLKAQGVKNVYLLPNCKPLRIVCEGDNQELYKEPYKLVTFSRVTEKKGIGDAVDAVNYINDKYKRNVFSLDIYGPVDEGDRVWFDKLKQSFSAGISYKGCASSDNTASILHSYFLLLFPTYFFTEGLPGTIIDAYAAGLPVLSSRWNSFQDIIDDGKTGYGFEIGNRQEMISLLERIMEYPEMVTSLKVNCIQKAKTFMPEKVLSVLVNKLV